MTIGYFAQKELEGRWPESIIYQAVGKSMPARWKSRAVSSVFLCNFVVQVVWANSSAQVCRVSFLSKFWANTTIWVAQSYKHASWIQDSQLPRHAFPWILIPAKGCRIWVYGLGQKPIPLLDIWVSLAQKGSMLSGFNNCPGFQERFSRILTAENETHIQDLSMPMQSVCKAYLILNLPLRL